MYMYDQFGSFGSFESFVLLSGYVRLDKDRIYCFIYVIS